MNTVGIRRAFAKEFRNRKKHKLNDQEEWLRGIHDLFLLMQSDFILRHNIHMSTG